MQGSGTLDPLLGLHHTVQLSRFFEEPRATLRRPLLPPILASYASSLMLSLFLQFSWTHLHSTIRPRRFDFVVFRTVLQHTTSKHPNAVSFMPTTIFLIKKVYGLIRKSVWVTVAKLIMRCTEDNAGSQRLKWSLVLGRIDYAGGQRVHG